MHSRRKLLKLDILVSMLGRDPRIRQLTFDEYFRSKALNFRWSRVFKGVEKANCHEFVDRSACQVLVLEADALEFERAVKVQACLADDLHAIACDCALHGSTAGAELLRTKCAL